MLLGEGRTVRMEKKIGSSRQWVNRESNIAIIKKAIKEGLLDEVPFKQRPNRGEGVSQEDI